MLVPAILSIIALLAEQTPSSPSCTPIVGSALVLAHEDKRFIIVGERHGTSEIPALFSDLICAALSRGPVVVGLEIQADQQESLDRYMASEGDEAARLALLSNKHWRSTDGRASEAMFQLIDNVRRLGKAGKPVSLRALMPMGDSPEAREGAMGDAWKSSLAGRPDSLLLMLVGSIHAEREPMGNFTPAAHALPSAQTLTLGYFTSGKRGIFVDAPAAWRWPHVDLYYSVGTPLSSSAISRAVHPTPSSPTIPPQQ